MAFDLVQYFVEQIETQKPRLLNQYSAKEKREFIREINALALGQLITQWRTNDQQTYLDLQTADELYIREIARRLTTSTDNHSKLSKAELEFALGTILELQLAELKQLDQTAQLQISGMRELLLGQIEHLTGQAENWVWSTNNLIELINSKISVQETVSLETTMKEFQQMVQQHDTTPVDTAAVTVTPTWAKVLEPIVALVILWILWNALTTVFA
jgi:hypothetical protein